MTKKSLGYVQLEWTCPNCETRNPGSQKTCSNCGMPQPDDVQFEQPAQEKIITDEAGIAKAKTGPDIHCYYCGARNPATAETCSQCGASLSEGTARAGGQVLGAHRRGPAPKVTCPSCGTENEADAPKCIQCGAALPKVQPQPKPAAQAKAAPAKRGGFGVGAIIAIAVLLLVVAGCVTFFVLASRTEDLTGRVDSVAWTRNIAIEGLVPVEHEDWRNDIPAEGLVGTCTQRVARTQDNPAPNSREVCGTPYTVDSGNGFGEVVQDCKYEVLEDWCKYTVDEWQKIDTVTQTGNDYKPRWPNLNLRSGQRDGDREEIYQIVFDTEQGTYTYETSNFNLYQQAQVGSRWLLKVNTFNSVTDIEPMQ